MNNPIPSFKSPPLNEVFLGVQYEPIEAFDITTYGTLWEKFRDHFPKVEHHMPLEPSFERIGARVRSPNDLSRFKIEQFASSPMPRAWFVNENEQELVQIQTDRFIRNWRRLDNANVYPRYEEHMRSEFLDNLKVLDGFYQENNMGELKPNQCDLSYINHIDADKPHSMLSDVFLGWSNEYDLSEIADIEDVQLNMKHIVKDSSGEFVGRLYVKVQPAIKVSNEKPIFLIELTIKGRPLGEGSDGVMNFMDMGREKIVRAFTKMTTSEMHDIWVRER